MLQIGDIFMTNDTSHIPHPEIEIVADEPESKNPILIEGFPGIGLIGNIASQQIIDELEMKYLGTMSSQYFPPIAVLFEGIVNMPVRIYESKEHEIIVVVSDIPIQPAMSHIVSRALIDWAVSINVKAVSYTHLRAHETRHDLVCRLLLEKKKKKKIKNH